MSENKITFPVKLASNNPQSFGIADATEISGHRSVETLSELYAISDPVLSILKDGSDAIGQEWFVISEDCKYRLDNWESRKSASGWTKLPKQELINTKQSVSEKDQPGGYAGLDSNGKIPIEKTYGTTATVVDVATYESLPVTGVSGVIYYVSNTGAQYKWSGSAYIDITGGEDNAKKNETSIFDCSNGTSTKYYSSLSEAINVVPPAYRTSNRIISYLSTENSTTSAVNYQYHGIDSTTWTDSAKWERIPNQADLADLADIRSDLSGITNDIYDNSILRGAEITDGGLIEPGNGQLVENAGWCYTDYIAIKPNTAYGPIVFCAWYDENKVYIEGVLDANAGTHTSPSNAKYARFSIVLSNKKSWAIAEGGVIVDGWQKKIFTKNLIKKTTVTDGGYIEPSTGQFISDEGWCYTDYMPITFNKYYGLLGFAAWYRSDKTYISGVLNAEGEMAQAPSNAGYLRASTIISTKDYWSISENGEDDTLEGEILENKIGINNNEIEINKLREKIFTKNIIKNTTITDGGFVEPSNGQVVSDQTYCYTDYISIEPNTNYGPIVFCAWYNENKVYIEGVLDANAGTHTSPSNAKYARFSINLPTKESWYILENGEDGTIEGRIRKNEIRINELEAKKELTDGFHVGTGYDYASFSAAIAAASSSIVNTPTVYVHSGTYDLISENQARASLGAHLILIEKSMKIIFAPDAKLTALFPSSYEYYTGCSPIFIIGNADVTFEGMNIECSNCLYCVHDESYGNYTYTHKFINCNMKYTTQHSDGVKQCIGGGLGRFCTIIIDGGVYESDTSSWDTLGVNELVISYHNGVNNSDNKSVLYVKNLYLKNKGRMEFTHCGHTEIMTGVYVCNCSMGADVTIPQGSGQYYFVDNIQLFAWNNVVRNNS